MNAVTTKPRARKAAAAAQPEPQVGEWVQHINEVRSMVRQSLSLTCQALEKADYGKPAYTLLTCASAEFSTILRYLDRGPVSEADAQFLNDDGMWPALGMLSGALSLLEHDPEEAALAPAVREAHKTLDGAHSGLDSALVAEIGAPQLNVARRDFCLGRNLAIEMLAAGDAIDNTDQSEPYRWMRGGAAQNRFALPFLRRLHTEPELIEGFAAVLSARLGTGDHTAADYYDLPMAEYEAGDVGADGTEVDTSSAPTPTAPATFAPAPPSADAAHPVIRIPVEAVGPMMTKLDQAVAALTMLGMHFGGDSGMEEPTKVDGLMGTLQFVQRTLSDCWGVVMEAKDPPEPLYWGTFLAHSLVTLLEEHQGADAYMWTMPESILFGTLTAARDQAETALTFLVQAESQS